ncbi:TPA: GNAT family N-acetyltransferase [Methanosarcina acetivorans]|uniref:Acetyltransferase (GNAT) family protein n=2 Tax=Methanosarcina acetivorans TaxID=2214 RepID=Q8TS86_METAC|nr:GNAT family N-acetyltransferase [Methanosarcina acetivorans]AAM04351.1 acetyltransferase (GNAT) family protein [Methanosarcina acetivorans C2A]HIH93527.1 GNAT family N-acetyltransferase [Methanosarcina acetivorans]
MKYMVTSETVYKESPPTRQEYSLLFSSTGWTQILKISEDDLKKVFENTWYWITAYQERNIVGVGRLLSDGALYALICDIIVMPDHQNRGIGTEILTRLVKKCQESNIRRVWLFAAPEKARFYEKHGFFIRPDEAPGMQLREFELTK